MATLTLPPDPPAPAPLIDARLLALAAKCEAAARRHNGFYEWRIKGTDNCLQGPAYIEDDDVRSAALEPLDRRMEQAVAAMLEEAPTTVDGMQALARCIVLSACDIRTAVAELFGPQNGRWENLSLSTAETMLVVMILRGLTNGAITYATAPMFRCRSFPGRCRCEQVSGRRRGACPGALHPDRRGCQQRAPATPAA